MARHIHTIFSHIHTLCAQSGPLFIARRRAQRQAQAPACAEYPVPGQAGIGWQLPEGAADPTCRSPKPGQLGELAIADDLAFRHLAKHRIQGRSSGFG